MGSLWATTGSRFRKAKISNLKRECGILVCTLLILLVSKRSIGNWLSSIPSQPFTLSYGDGNYTSCNNFTDPTLKHRYESLKLLPEGEKYLWYSPHEGFSNQARELRNALEIAMLLNRTLIIPPVTDHGEVKHGSCLKPRYPTQRKLKERSWSAVSRHFIESRYVSIADIVDLRPLSPKLVRAIDMRVFLALWCGLDIASVCSGSKCWSFADALSPNWGSLALCSQKLLPSSKGSSCSVYEVEDDCPTTIWTNGENPLTRDFLEHELMEKIRNDPELSHKTSLMSADFGLERKIVRKDVVKTLGPGSEAADYFLLSFGTLFSRMYKHMELHVNIRAAVGDRTTAAKLEVIQGGHAFTKEIMRGAKYLLEQKFANRPYFCAHMRMGDGYFVNFKGNTLKKKLEELTKKNRNNNRKLQIFLMSDLRREKWNGTILSEIDNSDRYQVHTLNGYEDFVSYTAQQMMESEHGLRLGFVPNVSTSEQRGRNAAVVNPKSLQSFVPDVRLYLEEIICACAPLGFLGTYRSTVSRNINDLRSAGLCPR